MELHSEYPEIVAELEAMRPRPRPDFADRARRLRRRGLRDSTRRDASLFDRLGERLSGLSWRRVAVPVGAAALIAIAVATAVISISESGPAADEGRIADHPVASPEVAPSPAPSDSGANLNEFSQKVPQVVGSSGTGSAAGAGAAESGPYAARARVRDIERSARVTLAVDPDDVRSAASDVFATVHSYDGIVLSSSGPHPRQGRRGRLLRSADPERQARRRARRLLGHRAGQLPLRRLGRRHGADDRARGKGAGLEGEDREPAQGAVGG